MLPSRPRVVAQKAASQIPLRLCESPRLRIWMRGSKTKANVRAKCELRGANPGGANCALVTGARSVISMVCGEPATVTVLGEKLAVKPVGSPWAEKVTGPG